MGQLILVSKFGMASAPQSKVDLERCFKRFSMVAFDTCHVFVASEIPAKEHDGGPVQSKLEPSCSCPSPNIQIQFEYGGHEK